MKAYSLSKELTKIIDLFLEDSIQEFEIKLNVVFSKEELNELIGKYDSNSGIVENGITIDEYVYDISKNVLKKIIIEYVKINEENIVVLDIEGFTDFIS